MSLPSNTTLPPSGLSTPVMRLNKVVLPAPFGPTTDTTSPAPTENDTSLTANSPPKRRGGRLISSPGEIAKKVPGPVIWIATTLGLLLFPLGGVCDVTCGP